MLGIDPFGSARQDRPKGPNLLRISLTGCFLSVIFSLNGCVDRVPALETEPNQEIDPDDPRCAVDAELTPKSVVTTGYGVLYKPPSEDAHWRSTNCPRPSWLSETRACAQSNLDWRWHTASSSEEAQLRLLWIAWCWHGVDLSVDGRVTCDPEIGRQPAGMGYPKWVCQVEYQDDSAEQTVNLPDERR